MDNKQEELNEAKQRAANYMSLKGALEPMENKKTAMQELFDSLEAIDIIVPNGVKQIFLKKEKEQIVDAHRRVSVGLYTDAEQYYNETFKNKQYDKKRNKVN
jgi:hypothetical protein